MEKKFYNNFEDEKFQEVIEVLQDLPDIKAPDNFEFRIITKIENKNYELTTERTFWGKIRWTIKPAIAFGFSAVVLFFVAFNESGDLENPLLTAPKRNDVASVKPDTITMNRSAVADISVLPKSKKGALSDKRVEPNNVETYRVVLQPNDVVTGEKVDYPFNEKNSVPLDNMLNSGVYNRQPNNRSTLAGAGNRNYHFNGFYIREVEKEKLDTLKNKIDSLKNHGNGKK